MCSFQGTIDHPAFASFNWSSHLIRNFLFTKSNHQLKGLYSISTFFLFVNSFFFLKSGSHLLSHAVSSIVPSAAQVLTIVFGMGTGVSPERIATGNIYLLSYLRICTPKLSRFRFAPSREIQSPYTSSSPDSCVSKTSTESFFYLCRCSLITQ